MSIGQLGAVRKNYFDANRDALLRMCGDIVADFSDSFTCMYCAAWPLHLDWDAGDLFLGEPEAFARWLHGMQSLDVWYAGAVYTRTEEGVQGCFNYLDGLPAIFLKEPQPPLELSGLQVDRWLVELHVGDWEHPVGQIAYADFMARLPQEKVSPYDAAAVLVKGLTEAEIRALLEP